MSENVKNVTEEKVTEEKAKPTRSRSRAKTTIKIEEVVNELYLKGIAVKETIIIDDTMRHDRADCVVYESKLSIKGANYRKIIKFNLSRNSYQALIGVDGGVRSLSFFPHVDHAQKAMNTYLERMM